MHRNRSTSFAHLFASIFLLVGVVACDGPAEDVETSEVGGEVVQPASEPDEAALGSTSAPAALDGGEPSGVMIVMSCDALTLYGNAAKEGLCKSLSPATQNHKVCALASTPDIHLTFNAGTPLHLTVRNPQGGCEGYSTLDGTFPGGLAILAGQPAQVCGVSVQNYVDRFNAVDQAGPAPFCERGFVDAIANGRLDVALAQGYIDLCRSSHCA